MATDCDHEKSIIIVQNGNERERCPICEDVTVQTLDFGDDDT